VDISSSSVHLIKWDAERFSPARVPLLGDLSLSVRFRELTALAMHSMSSQLGADNSVCAQPIQPSAGLPVWRLNLSLILLIKDRKSAASDNPRSRNVNFGYSLLVGCAFTLFSIFYPIEFMKDRSWEKYLPKITRHFASRRRVVVSRRYQLPYS